MHDTAPVRVISGGEGVSPMLNLVFVEAAVELVPGDIAGHPSVRRNARRAGKRPEETLLDRSLHHFAMRSLPKAEKRGRPDIAHFCLLEALGSPLNMRGGMATWLNTVDGRTIWVNPAVRLPRIYDRYKGLLEQLLVEGRVPPGGGEALMEVLKLDIAGLMGRVNPTRTVALTSHGKPRSLEELCGELSQEERPMVFLGAYPRGPMERATLMEADEAVSIYPDPLEAWVVISRLIYEFEKASGIW